MLSDEWCVSGQTVVQRPPSSSGAIKSLQGQPSVLSGVKGYSRQRCFIGSSLLSICSWVHTPTHPQELKCKTFTPPLLTCYVSMQYYQLSDTTFFFELPSCCLCLPFYGQRPVGGYDDDEKEEETHGSIQFLDPWQSFSWLPFVINGQALFRLQTRFALDQWLLFHQCD